VLRQQVRLALVCGSRELVGEEVVAGHPVEDVVDSVHVPRRDETAGGDRQDVAEVKALRGRHASALRTA
jgi:hypothetical protein